MLGGENKEIGIIFLYFQNNDKEKKESNKQTKKIMSKYLPKIRGKDCKYYKVLG